MELQAVVGGVGVAVVLVAGRVVAAVVVGQIAINYHSQFH